MSDNTTAVIVALPTVLDKVRLVGDEDKHATLLFFGETSTLPEDAQSVLIAATKQASELAMPFGEEIINVERLGSDNPPALVAMLSNYRLNAIRNLLLMNPDVKGYLSNVDQYPKFTPHVTLGYPDYQEEKDLRNLIRNVYSIDFDRLALWWNDEHTEFDLGAVPSSSLAMSDNSEEVLEHHGIKGQKWGVRRPRDSATGLVARKSSADQISQDRIAKKIASGGKESLSNADIQAYTRRLQLQKDLDRALTEQSASAKAKSDGFIKSFIKKQGARQFDRVANKAIDVAIEQALFKAAAKTGQSNPDLAANIATVSKRLAPKKGK